MNNIYDPSSPDPSKVTFFDFGKTASEILENTRYEFTLHPEILVRNSETTRRARRNRKKGIKKAPRRQNPWIIYRRDKSANEAFSGLKSSVISKRVSIMWKHEPKEVKDLFEVLAKIAEGIHETEHKDYKYVPGPSKKSKPERKNNSNDMYEGKILCFPTPTTDNTMSTYSDPPTPTNDTTIIKLSSSPPPTPTTDMTMLPSPTYSNPPTPKSNIIMIKLSSSPPTFTIPGPPTPTSMPPTPTTLTADTDMSSPSPLTPTSPTPTSPIDMPPSEAITTNPAYLICYNNTILVPSVPWDQNLCLQSPDIPDFPSMEQAFFSTPQDEDSDEIHNTTTTTTTTTSTTTMETIKYVEEYSLFPGLEEIEMQYPLQFPLNDHY
ncbi:hypothetical protein RhiirC2_776887 [Rhizophagus irregularis]|uniref:MATA-HMG n=1 Tax=Rhizophagus irregularis TaxID=588596 RepID=A0A1B1ETT3_9GLOM|nr:MATA-HMG [Rhizophagus irregularis]PKK72703.1 hypothetical protein RhiirC2_776887 [Rhizophagus irregularis]